MIYGHRYNLLDRYPQETSLQKMLQSISIVWERLVGLWKLSKAYV
jgi:hypothetical protein